MEEGLDRATASPPTASSSHSSSLGTLTKQPNDSNESQQSITTKEDEITEPEERSPVFESRVERATELWEQGKTQFRDGSFVAALKTFETALFHVDFDELSYNFELLDVHRAAVDRVRVPLYLNAAACLLKLERPREALEQCDKVLKQDPNHVKALYRRARAREALGEVEKACADLEKAHAIARDDAEVVKALVAMRKKQQEAQKASDELWRGKIKLSESSSSTSKPGGGLKPNALEGDEGGFFLVRFFRSILAWVLSWFAMFSSAGKAKTG